MIDAVAADAARALEEHAGLRLEGSGRVRLARVLGEAAVDSGVCAERIVERLRPGSPELADLVDRVTLQETSWFRDPAWWEVLRGTLLPDAVRAHAESGRAGPLTIWSAGCATGEEAYSLAIACDEAAIADWRIVGTDVSRPAVARAAAGWYGPRALRGLSDERRDRALVRDGDGWRVRDDIRARVELRHENLTRTPPPVPDGSCALVLCRYVLIYLSPASARTLLDRIARVLEPGGRLLIGAAESLWHISDRFAVEPLDAAFAYRLRDDAPVRPPRVPPPGREAPPRAGTAPRAVTRPPAAARPPAASTAEEPATLLARGERAITAGDVEAAVAAFRGAAYLDPDHPLAHLQLGLALERAEDPGAARAFRAAWSALSRTDPARLQDEIGGYRAEELVHLVAAKLEASR